MKRILKEPFIHFLLIGGLLFLLYGMLNKERDESEIVIDDNLVNELVAKWELKRNRQPTFEELENLIDEYIQQEVLYKEALVMKLDHNDEIVKRRLAQKMEFISDGLTESLQPTKEMLMAYYEKNKAIIKRILLIPLGRSISVLMKGTMHWRMLQMHWFQNLRKHWAMNFYCQLNTQMPAAIK
jgi:hypothetical protein